MRTLIPLSVRFQLSNTSRITSGRIRKVFGDFALKIQIFESELAAKLQVLVLWLQAGCDL